MESAEKKIIKKLNYLKRDPKKGFSINVYDEKSRALSYLKPIQYDFDYGIVSLLSKWRKENPSISTSSFKITHERTKKWLNNFVLNRKDRIIFMIYNLKNNPMGHIGLSNFDFDKNIAELDSVLRGVKDILPGLMFFCVKAIIDFGFQYLKLSGIQLSVLSDNKRAIDFYKKLNFSEIHRIPLVKLITKDETRYESKTKYPDLPIEKYYIKMKYLK